MKREHFLSLRGSFFNDPFNFLLNYCAGIGKPFDPMLFSAALLNYCHLKGIVPEQIIKAMDQHYILVSIKDSKGNIIQIL